MPVVGRLDEESEAMNNRDMQRHRRWVREWHRQLRPLATRVKTRNPDTGLRRLYALGIAMLEASISGFIEMHGEEATCDIIGETFDSIIRSRDDPNHWRHGEVRMEAETDRSQ